VKPLSDIDLPQQARIGKQGLKFTVVGHRDNPYIGRHENTLDRAVA